MLYYVHHLNGNTYAIELDNDESSDAVEIVNKYVDGTATPEEAAMVYIPDLSYETLEL